MNGMTSSKPAALPHQYQYSVKNITKLTGNAVGVLAQQVALSNFLNDELGHFSGKVIQPGFRWDSKAIAKSLELAQAECKSKKPTALIKAALIVSSDPKTTAKRQRLTRDQKDILEAQYLNRCEWDGDLVDDLAM